MVGADTLMRWAELSWLNALGLGARMYSSLHLAEHHPRCAQPHPFQCPWTPRPSLHGGRPSSWGLYPFGPITDGAALNVTVLSQDDRVGFGIITCPDLVPRVWDLAGALQGSLKELLVAADSESCTRSLGEPFAVSLPVEV